MKKITAIMVSAMMLLSMLVLSACGGSGSSEDLSDSKYVGTWKAAAVAIGEESGDLEGEYLLIINGDGTGVLTGEEDSNFTWTPTDNGFKTKGDVKLTFRDDGDTIKANLFGADLVFERQ